MLRTLRDEGMKVSISVSGVLLEMLNKYRSDIIDTLRELVRSKLVELVCEPYHHSLAMFVDEETLISELSEQIKLLERIFSFRPRVAFNTEALYHDDLAPVLRKLGFEACVTEWTRDVMAWREPTYMYMASKADVALILRHYVLSDDVAFRFCDRRWDAWPLTADKYISWIKRAIGEFVLIGLDIETFGHHFKRETGILEFLRWIPREARSQGVEILTLSELLYVVKPVDRISFGRVVSWAGTSKDESMFLGNEMQRIAFDYVKSVRHDLDLRHRAIDKIWRLLLTSDHFHHMSTRGGSDWQVSSYFNPYRSPYRAFMHYVNAVDSLLILNSFVSRRSS